MHGVRQTHPVRGRAEAHVLLHTPTVPLTRGDREPAEQGTRIADAASGVTGQAWANPAEHYDDDLLAALASLIALVNTCNPINVATRQPAGDYQSGQRG